MFSGKANPSGKLPDTFPKRLQDVSSYNNFPSSQGNPNLVEYKEGIYVGYRYFDTPSVNTQKVEPEYPFGYGLSYTTFKYSKLRIDPKKLTVQVDITNTGPDRCFTQNK